MPASQRIGEHRLARDPRFHEVPIHRLEARIDSPMHRLAIAADAFGDGDGQLSARELGRFRDQSPLAPQHALRSYLHLDRRIVEAVPALERQRRQLIRSLVRAEGSATEADVRVVVDAMMRLPRSTLIRMRDAGASVVVCRGSVTDYLTHLKGKRPRGWPKGSTWDTVPGCLYEKSVVVATTDGPDGSRILPPTGRGHGAYDLLLHEWGHLANVLYADDYPRRESTRRFLDSARRHPDHEATSGLYNGFPCPIAPTPTELAEGIAPRSARSRGELVSERDGPFVEARRDDWDALPPYMQQGGPDPGTNAAGGDETWAESLGRYFGDDPAMARQWPHLYDYWQQNRLP